MSFAESGNNFSGKFALVKREWRVSIHLHFLCGLQVLWVGPGRAMACVQGYGYTVHVSTHPLSQSFGEDVKC